MKRVSTSLGILLFLGLCVPVFAQSADALGFCPPPATVPACTNGNGVGGESISIPTTSIGMIANATGSSSSPWYLILALPNYNGAAPTLTIAGGTFTESGTPAHVDWGTAFGNTGDDLYQVAHTVVSGVSDPNSSLSFGNLTGANEQDALCGSSACGAPGFFDVFVYTYTPGVV